MTKTTTDRFSSITFVKLFTLIITAELETRTRKPATCRSCVPAFSVSGIVPAFTCVLSALLRGDVKLTCVCLRLREQCLRSKITSVARVAHVLLLRSVTGNVEVNTLASKRCWKAPRNPQKSTCVCLHLPVATIFWKRKVDLWPA